MNIKAAIFDMDGTLADSLNFWGLFWPAIGEKFLNNKEFKPTAEDDKRIRTLTLWDTAVLLHDHYQIGKSSEEVFAFSDAMILDYYTNTVELKSGVKEFLAYCHDLGVKMCVASATAPALIRVALKRCGIEHYFLELFSCSTYGKGKEHPDVYLAALAYLGEKPEETWVFEDSLTAIETATRIGMPTVAIYDAYNYGQEEMRQIATEYIAPGETLMRLVK